MFDLRLQRRPLPWHAIVCTVILALFSIWWSAQAAFASDSEIIGHVEVMPTDGLMGAWVVDDVAFIADNETDFQTEKGDFAVGRCVEVEYINVGEQVTATKLATKSDDDCAEETTPTETATPESTIDATATTTPTVTASVTPSATHEDDEHDDDEEGDVHEIYGVVNQLPADGFRGLWIIDGEEYHVGGGARIRQKDGPIRVGACVEVRYRMGTTPYPVLRMETEHQRKCHDATPTPISTVPPVTPTPDDEDENEIYGTLDSFPADLIGEWVIAGEAYTATTDTEFDEERGLFVVNACVKAHLSKSDATVMREVETTNRFRCDGNDDNNQVRGELYGVIQEFPAELIGDWQIGGLTITADAGTEFKQRHGAFAKGVTVKVHFVLRDGSLFYATEIETKFVNDHHGDDDDHNDIYEGAEGHAYGLIESFPPEWVGEWVVGGISYTVTSETHFVQPHSNFDVDIMVRVKYRTDADGNRIARQIKTTSSNGGASGEGHATLFGYVDEMPVNGFIGEWVIDGVSFHANGTTKFQEEHGLLGLGSYVKMEYFTSDGRNVLHEIESEVPPGAGDDTTIGDVESIGDESGNNTIRSSAITSVNASIWIIGGQEYVVTAATDLNDFQGELVVGSTAMVNSYTADDGSLVATQVRGITLGNTIFLPTIRR